MALGYAGVLFFGKTVLLYYVMIAIAGIGWASVVSLPFAIMSEKVNQSKIALRSSEASKIKVSYEN